MNSYRSRADEARRSYESDLRWAEAWEALEAAAQHWYDDPTKATARAMATAIKKLAGEVNVWHPPMNVAAALDRAKALLAENPDGKAYGNPYVMEIYLHSALILDAQNGGTVKKLSADIAKLPRSHDIVRGVGHARIAIEQTQEYVNQPNADEPATSETVPQQKPEVATQRESEVNTLELLESETPPLDKQSGKWVRNKRAADLDSVETDTLRTYRRDGEKNRDRTFGRDAYGRIWRRTGTPNSHPWYLRSTLPSEQETVDKTVDSTDSTM